MGGWVGGVRMCGWVGGRHEWVGRGASEWMCVKGRVGMGVSDCVLTLGEGMVRGASEWMWDEG